jgi:hypothetical protein
MEEVDRVRYEGFEFDIPLLHIIEQRLPPIRREPGTFYVVSGIVQARARRRDDFLVPSRVVRDGDIISGCRAFSQISRVNGHDG